jgi:hypothetical protein
MHASHVTNPREATSMNQRAEINLNASLILCGGYDKNKTHSFLFMLSILDGLKMIYFCS